MTTYAQRVGLVDRRDYNATITIGCDAKTKTFRGRVTPKRIDVAGSLYKRDTGRKIGAYHPSMTAWRVISYQIDGEPTVLL